MSTTTITTTTTRAVPAALPPPPLLNPIAPVTTKPPPAPILILIAGAPCSGKKAVMNELKNKLFALSQNLLHISTLHMLDFHNELNDEESKSAREGSHDMECLAAFELGLMADVVQGLGRLGADGNKEGNGGVRAPKWDFRRKKREWGGVDVEGGAETKGAARAAVVIPDVVIAEGSYLLCEKRLVEMASVKIFVECDPDVRLARRVIRDSTERNLSLEHIFDQYVRFGKPAAEIAIQPTKVLADIILPRGAEGPGIELIAHGVLDDLKQLKGKKAGPGHTLALYPTTTTTTLKEADLVGTTSSLAYYETV